ncbi:MAG: GntR family transcriptional regulator [Phycisphaeraceae bacterium]
MNGHTGTRTGTTVYESLAERLRVSIREGRYKPGDLIGSEHQLARQVNISRMTVRRASELLVREGLLERRPGKGLYVRADNVTTRLIQIVAGNLQWEPSVQVSRGVQALAKARGIQVQLYDAHGDVEQDLTMLRQLPEGPAAGAIIMSLHSAAFNEAVFRLKAEGFPFVLVDQRLSDIEAPSVMADNYAGGYQVGQSLLKQGHRRIAFIGDIAAATVGDRLAGLRDAIADAGLPFDRSLVVELKEEQNRLGGWSEEIERATRDVRGRPEPPTAIFYSCDGVARPGYRALAAMNLRVPEDISVVGFDDDPLAEWLNPPLTTVRQPFSQMGEAAIELLCQRMENPRTPVEHRVLPAELVQRASTAAAPDGV